MMFITVVSVSLTPAFAASSQEDVPIKGKSAIVIDKDSGKILYEKDAYTKREPASITKIMTCMLTLENLDMDKMVTITGKVETLGNVLNLKEGEEISVKDLLYGLMLHSSNDVAEVLAKEVAGSIDEFSVMMNDRAKECGAKDTNFSNPNGLNWAGQENHLTTAYDMAMITKEAMKNPTFCKLVTTVKYTIPATNKSDPRKIGSTNPCLWDTKTKLMVNGRETAAKYEGTEGVKTGLTSTAGACFVGAVDKNGSELISVVLNSGETDRFADTIGLWDYSFDTYYDTHKMASKGEELEKVRVKRGALRSVMTVAEKSASATVVKGTSTDGIYTKFVASNVSAPVKKGQVMGEIQVFDGDEMVSKANALAVQRVEEGGPLSYIGISDNMAVAIYIFVGLAILILIMLRLLRGKPKSKKTRGGRSRSTRSGRK